MIRKAVRRIGLALLVAAAAGSGVLWLFGRSCGDSGKAPHYPHDCAWGHWVTFACGDVVGRHARLELWSGNRLFLRTDDDGFSVALITPFEWSSTAPNVRHERWGFGFERQSSQPRGSPVYWDIIDCRNASTFDDLVTVVTVPGWFPVVVFLAYPLLAFVRGPLRRRHRRRRNRCISCGYDLTGLPESRCPECGTAIVSRPFTPIVDYLPGRAWLRGNVRVRRVTVAGMVLVVMGPWMTISIWGSSMELCDAGIALLCWAGVGLAVCAAWWASDDGRTVAKRTVLGMIGRHWPLAASLLVAGVYAYLGYVWFVLSKWG